jgi:stage III sporulation protein AB
MLKIVGATLIIFSTTLAGFYFAQKLSTRSQQLRELQMSLQLLETEIIYGSTPLETAFYKLSKTSAGAIGTWFERCVYYLENLDGATTFECWEKALLEVKPKLALKKTELEWLHHFGKMIGNSDSNDQQKHLQLMLSQLSKIELDAKEEQHRYEKVYKTLGVLVGAFVVVLMM